MSAKPFNLIVAGIGGQGVVSLIQPIWLVCEQKKWLAQGSINKGGAQQHGSVHAELRVFSDSSTDYSLHSPQIPDGELDLLIALEPWEALRYQRTFGKNTKIITNTRVIPLVMERYLKDFNRSPSRRNPIEELSGLGHPMTSSDYTQRAIENLGKSRWAGLLMIKDACDQNLLPFDWKSFSISCTLINKIPKEIREKI